jgi:GNAT superfamily N-acetyltransferase
MMAAEPRRDLVVTPAGPDDAAALRRLLLDANEEHRPGFPEVVFANYLDDLMVLVGNEPPAGMVVVRDTTDGRLVGTGTVMTAGALHSFWPAGTVILRAMAVAPSARGAGVGGVVGRACLERARQLGASAVGLHTAPIMADAMRLYAGLGFVRWPSLDVPIDEIFGPAGEPYDDRALAFRLDLTW